MKFLMIRWKLDPWYPNPSSSPSAVLPVHRARKFSAVLGTVLPVFSTCIRRCGKTRRGSLSVETHDDSTHWLTTMFDVEVDLMVRQSRCRVGDREVGD